VTEAKKKPKDTLKNIMKKRKKMLTRTGNRDILIERLERGKP